MKQVRNPVKNIEQIIRTNLANPELKGAFIAKELGVSRMTIHRLLKQRLNQNTRAYILDIRIQYAKIQLRNSSKYIYQIAKEIGYPDTKYFTKVFKKKTGKSPSMFRQGKN